MKNLKLITYILSVLMLAVLVSFAAFAADDEFTIDKDYTSEYYASPEEKLATMGVKNVETGERTPNFENDEYEIWAHEWTGEVGIRVKSTGQIILTNPYDVASSNATSAVKQELLSQIILQYKDSSGAIVSFNSYKDAALNGKIIKSKSYSQINVKTTRSGIRVEYTLGKEQAKYVLPKQIEKESFETNILENWADKDSRDYRRFVSYYSLKDPNDKTLSPTVLTSMKAQFPATEKYAIYVLDPGATNKEFETLSGYLAANTDYDEQQLAADYELIDYIDTSAAPAIFRFAIEYNLDENGITISVPANSITYDSSTYTLSNVKLLPYLGAGNNDNTGFTFLPDGSGTITRFEDIKGKQLTLTGKVYGKDYSFHAISGYNQETVRIPAVGVLENKSDENGVNMSNGFVAYYEDGASLLELTSYHGGTVHNYSSVYATFYPKDSDTYSLTGISEDGKSATWTINGNRRYTGNYSMRILPLYGEDLDYTDMAKAVREYLEKTGVLTRLEEENDNENVPLYVENFGTIKTDEKVLGFPVKLQTSLTTFEQTEGIIDDLNKRGISNINIRLTGWYNGGMQHKAPSTLSVPGNIGGMSGLKELAKYAEEKGVGLYPDLDYTYVEKFGMFDGISESKDTAKTLDGRDAEHRVYNALYQGFENDDKSIISSGSLKKLYKKIRDEYEEIGATGISVASLGSDLNSNHDEDYVINRDQSEELVANFLKQLKKRNGSVMTDGGNAYSLGYADHILNVPLESSMNINTSQSIPFMGMVLHGYTEFAGTPINLDGDYDSSVLKAIENGASLYFMVSKENTSELKAFPEFNKYYAISYDNWASDIETTYKQFNEAMKGVKYSLIDEHEELATRLVRVKYDNGTEFVLNYNTHAVTLDDGTEVEAMSFAVR